MGMRVLKGDIGKCVINFHGDFSEMDANKKVEACH